MKDIKDLHIQVFYLNGLRQLCNLIEHVEWCISQPINDNPYSENMSLVYDVQLRQLKYTFRCFDKEGVEEFIPESWLDSYKHVKLLVDN